MHPQAPHEINLTLGSLYLLAFSAAAFVLLAIVLFAWMLGRPIRRLLLTGCAISTEPIGQLEGTPKVLVPPDRAPAALKSAFWAGATCDHLDPSEPQRHWANACLEWHIRGPS